VRNYAVAVNPAGWIIAIMGGLICPWLTYPVPGTAESRACR
jgi:hypothetical protein